MGRLPKQFLVLLLVAALAGPLEQAIADVDPASDVLLLQNVFLPYQPKVCSQLKDQLRSVTAKSKSAGYSLKVAVIGSRQDLGGAPQFFGKPQEYAKFLGQELGVYGPDVGRNLASTALLVVMPQGFGTYQVAQAGAAAVKGISVDPKSDANGLARAAILAVPKVATATGHPIPAVKTASGCSKGGTSFLVYVAPVILLLAGGLLIRYGIRPRRPAEQSAGGAGGEA
jgi:hypothetical protein